MNDQRHRLIATFCEVHDHRVEFAKRGAADDPAAVLEGAKRLISLFQQWRDEAIDAWEKTARKRTKKSLREALVLLFETEWAEERVAKAKPSTATVELFVNSVWGPTQAERASTLARTRLLTAIDGYVDGKKSAMAHLDKVAGPFPKVAQATINSLLTDSLEFSNSTLSRITEHLRDELLAGVLRGDSVGELSTRIAEVFDELEQYEALRISRTEYARAQGAGKSDVYLDEGYEHAVWIKSPDACPICEGYHGRYYRLADLQKHFPAHPNCRCDFEPVESLPKGATVESDPPWNVFDAQFAGPLAPLGKSGRK